MSDLVENPIARFSLDMAYLEENKHCLYFLKTKLLTFDCVENYHK